VDLFNILKFKFQLFLLLACVFANIPEKELAKSLSFIPHDTIENSNIIVSTSLFYYKTNPEFALNSQLWVSPNLYMKGGISPGKYDAHLSPLIHLGLGYVPELPWLKTGTTAFELGIFQLKWYGEKSYKWQYGMIGQSFNYKHNTIHFTWTHLSDPGWYHEQFSIIVSRVICKIIGMQLQAVLYRDGNLINMNTVMTFSTAL